MRRFVLGVIALAACGGNDNPPPAVDAPAGGATVTTVSCTGLTPSGTISEDDAHFAFMPTAVTILQGQIVQFTTSATHNVVPNTGQDSGLTVPFGTTACLKFSAKGTFSFHCAPHGFQGTVTVN